MTTIHGTGQTQQGNSVLVGSRVKLLKSIYDDGEDHHPPGYLAYHGEVLIVKEVRGDVLAVAHEGNPGAFTIYPGEYETHNK